jgi:hypothetical protein
MEHLNIPKGCRSHAKAVPYLGIAPKYDRQGFEGFPERCGIDINDVSYLFGASEDGASSEETGLSLDTEYVESFLQEWLWFGLMHEFENECGLEMDSSQFIRSAGKDGEFFISTESLSQYTRLVCIKRLRECGVPLDLKVGDWVYYRPSPEEGPFQIDKDLGSLDYVVEGLPFTHIPASSLVRAIKQMDHPERSPSPCDAKEVPLLTLCQELELIHTPRNFDDPRTVNGGPVSRCSSKAAEMLSVMATVGEPVLRYELWMSIRILMFSLDDQLCSLFPGRAAVLDRDGGWGLFEEEMVKKNWCPARIEWMRGETAQMQYVTSLLPSHDTAYHGDCSTAACSNHLTSLSQLQTKHRTETCVCGEIPFSEVDLLRILRSGGVPGISEISGPQNQRYYELVDITGRSFVAISHVWAHGLGNPSRNSLPLCQLAHLFHLAKGISSPNPLLWIDTITVPVSSEYKKLALGKLRQVYQGANKVLVIDRHLLQVGPECLERRIQLRCCEWMRRLWTLQEGKLASDLYIQFKDGAAPLLELVGKPLRGSEMWMNTTFDALDYLSKRILEPFLTNHGDSRDPFMDLIGELAFRSVTVSTDEPICIATLLGLDLDSFESNPTMTDIYHSFHTLPQQLLFVPSPRLDVPGLRWAPSTFMNADHTPRGLNPERVPSATLNDRGFHVRVSAIFLPEDLQFSVGRRSSARFDLESSGFDGCLLATVSDDQGHSPEHYANAAVLLLDSASDCDHLMAGVLVTDFKELDDINQCRYGRQIFLYEKARINAWDISDFEDDFPEYLFATTGKFVEEITVCLS